MYNPKKTGKISQMKCRSFAVLTGLLLSILATGMLISCRGKTDDVSRILKKSDISRGICTLLDDNEGKYAIELACLSELLIYVQIDNDQDIETARRNVDEAGLYGSRIFLEKGDYSRIHLADNLVDIVYVPDETSGVKEKEILRVLRPGGKGIIGNKKLIKSFPEDIDEWSHPYHGPDNNPQSEDLIARGPYLTQFLAEPHYAPFPQLTVASGGRVFRAYGNIAPHEREEALLNSLVAYNGFNGTMLWKRKLAPGLMIHRNIMIATPDILYFGDDRSCKLINTSSGKVIDEIIPPEDIAGGTYWKWMALEDGILYALTGDQEHKDPLVKHKRESHGWPWYPLSKGFNDPEHPWGFGRHILAINPENKKVIWSHREEEAIDSRAMCMKNGRIYIYRHGIFLACVDANTGKNVWRKTPDNAPELFQALGPYLPRQDFRNNFRTTAYLKCSDEALYFAGPSMDKLLAVSTEDGNLMWEDPYNNFQLILRDEGLVGISGQVDKQVSKLFDPLTGEVLSEFDTRRRACTRPTGSIDAVFYRSQGGSVRMDMTRQSIEWISPMRPPCFDGVIISDGLLYWGAYVCDCSNSLYGLTCLGPAGDFQFGQEATDEERLEQFDFENVSSLAEIPADWPSFRANKEGTMTNDAEVPGNPNQLWWFAEETFTPTPPVAVGGMVFFSGSDGVIRALHSATGELQWKAYTGGPVRFPPAIWEGRAYVGSGDGWVYAFEARSGRLLWKFNAAPENRKIPVYGSLMSTWPVAGGVVVQDGIVYCAAGIVNYDGTHVYALDAISGEIIWQNNTSGHLDPESRTGVSVQGHILISDGKLYMAGGTSVSPAVFNLKDGRCLNDTPEQMETGFWKTSQRGQELYRIGDTVLVGGMPFYGHPEYPSYDFTCFSKMLLTSDRDKDLVLLNNRTIRCYNKTYRKTLIQSVVNPEPTQRWPLFDLNWNFPLIWERDCGEVTAMARCKNGIVLTGRPVKGYEDLNIDDRERSRYEEKTYFLKILDINDGKLLWGEILPSAPIDWGMAVDRNGRIIVALKDGQIMCFGAQKNEKKYGKRKELL